MDLGTVLWPPPMQLQAVSRWHSNPQESFLSIVGPHKGVVWEVVKICGAQIHKSKVAINVRV